MKIHNQRSFGTPLHDTTSRPFRSLEQRIRFHLVGHWRFFHPCFMAQMDYYQIHYVNNSPWIADRMHQPLPTHQHWGLKKHFHCLCCLASIQPSALFSHFTTLQRLSTSYIPFISSNISLSIPLIYKDSHHNLPNPWLLRFHDDEYMNVLM